MPLPEMRLWESLLPPGMHPVRLPLLKVGVVGETVTQLHLAPPPHPPLETAQRLGRAVAQALSGKERARGRHTLQLRCDTKGAQGREV